MLKAYKYRLYPNNKQIELINKHIGSARFVYNLALKNKLYMGHILKNQNELPTLVGVLTSEAIINW